MHGNASLLLPLFALSAPPLRLAPPLLLIATISAPTTTISALIDRLSHGRYGKAALFDALLLLRECCAKLGVPMADAALRYVCLRRFPEPSQTPALARIGTGPALARHWPGGSLCVCSVCSARQLGPSPQPPLRKAWRRADLRSARLSAPPRSPSLRNARDRPSRWPRSLSITLALAPAYLHSPMPAGSLAVAGVSSTAQVQSNLAALRDGPLPAPIVEAFEEAWKVARPACEPYFRGSAPA